MCSELCAYDVFVHVYRVVNLSCLYRASLFLKMNPKNISMLLLFWDWLP